MKLLPNWKSVAARAWVLKGIGFAAFIDMAQNVVPVVQDYIPWWVTVIILALASVARLLTQKGLSDEQA